MHNLIVGVTQSGKTNLCKAIARSLGGLSIVVFDPLKSRGWPEHAEKFHTPAAFLLRVETLTSAHVFIDEGKTLWDTDPKRADTLLYRRRHQGLSVFLMAQRAKMIPPNARSQCAKVFAFKQQIEDAKTLADEYGAALRLVTNHQQGEFTVSDGFSHQTGELDYSGGAIPTIVMHDSCQPDENKEIDN